MKTLNLNKLITLTILAFFSIIFSVGADASCYKTNGVIETYNGNTDAQVKSDRDGNFYDQCSDTPDEYEITFYKLGICTASTIENDLSSCQYILNNDSGVTHVIRKNTSGSMAIPKFAIDLSLIHI